MIVEELTHRQTLPLEADIVIGIEDIKSVREVEVGQLSDEEE